MGRNSVIKDENPIWWHLGRIVQTENTRVWEIQDRIGIVSPGDLSEENRTWLSQIEDNGEKKYRAESTNQEFWGPKRKLWKKRRGQELGDKTAWRKNSWRLLAMGVQRAVLEETIAVSVTMWISVEKWHSRIRLQILSCSRMREMRREPEVPEERVPVVECIDGPARITSKELAPIHSVKSGTLQNACSTRPRVVADLGKSAHTLTVRLMNSLAKGPKRMVTKVQWLCWTRMSNTMERRDPLYTTHQIPDNFGLRIAGYGAAEVFIDFTEERRHTETDPMCKIHESFCTSRRHSRPKSLARIYLPRWTSSAQPQRSKIWGSVSGGDRVARARYPRSSVEAGQKRVKIKGER